MISSRSLARVIRRRLRLCRDESPNGFLKELHVLGGLGCRGFDWAEADEGERHKTSRLQDARRKTQDWGAWEVLRAGEARVHFSTSNPGRCPGLVCFTPLGWGARSAIHALRFTPHSLTPHSFTSLESRRRGSACGQFTCGFSGASARMRWKGERSRRIWAQRDLSWVLPRREGSGRVVIQEWPRSSFSNCPGLQPE